MISEKYSIGTKELNFNIVIFFFVKLEALEFI